MAETQNAFVLRISPSNQDLVPEALKKDQLIIGWAEARGLLNMKLTWPEFRQIVKDVYYSNDSTFHRAGADAGNMWRFIREMSRLDLVVIPHGPHFYVGVIAGEAFYDESKVSKDSAYRRPVKWVNKRKPIPRSQARAALISRMKAYQTCVGARDLIDDIKEAVRSSSDRGPQTFEEDLRRRLKKEALEEIRSGRIDSYGFERLIESVLVSLGASETSVIPRQNDKGADLVASFLIAQTSKVVLAVQAKHYQPKPPIGRNVIEQLLSGMQAESADLGWVVTSGTFSSEARQFAEELQLERGIRIELVDGEQLASLVIEAGFKSVPLRLEVSRR